MPAVTEARQAKEEVVAEKFQTHLAAAVGLELEASVSELSAATDAAAADQSLQSHPVAGWDLQKLVVARKAAVLSLASHLADSELGEIAVG